MSKMDDLRNITLKAGHTYGVAVQLRGWEDTDGRLQFAIRAYKSMSFAEALRDHLEKTALSLGDYATIVEVVELGLIRVDDPSVREGIENLSVEEILSAISDINASFKAAKDSGELTEEAMVTTLGIKYTDFNVAAGSVYEYETMTLTKVGPSKWVSNSGRQLDIEDEILAIAALGNDKLKRVA